MSKKVAFLLAGVNAGGTENYLLRFIQYYRNEIDVTVYCKSGKLGELENEFLDAGVTLIPISIGYFNVKQFLRLQREFKYHQYEAVCDLTGSFGAIPLLMAKRVGIVKRIGFFRNSREKFTPSFLKLKYNRFITKLLPKVATKILSNSETALNYFYVNQWQNDSRFKVIYNGLDADKFLSKEMHLNLRSEFNIPQNAFVVGHVGRLNDQKNHPTLIKVALELVKKHQDVYFLFCGKNVGEQYQNQIKDEVGAERILFLGVRRDVNRILQSLDCFYFPSLIEGQPNALIEALMAGVAFVASNIEPIKETVPEAYHNQLVDPMDGSKAIEKIEEIKNHPERKQELNLSKWAIDYYDPKKWFNMFYKEL